MISMEFRYLPISFVCLLNPTTIWSNETQYNTDYFLPRTLLIDYRRDLRIRSRKKLPKENVPRARAGRA